MTLHNTFSWLWHLNNTVRSFRPAEVVHESLDWQLNYSTAAWSLCHGCGPQDGRTDGRMDGWMDGGGEFVLSLSIRAVGTTQCVYTLKTAGQMAEAIKCTDKMETNNRWGEENCDVRGFNKTAADGTSGSGTLSCPLSKTKTGHIPQGQAVGHSVGRSGIFARCTSESDSAGDSAVRAKISSLTTCLVIYFSFMIILMQCCN